MTADEQKVGGTIHNYRNDYKYKFGAKQNATSRWQLEFVIRSDEKDLIIEEAVSLLKDFNNMMKKEGFFPVVPKVYKEDTKKKSD